MIEDKDLGLKVAEDPIEGIWETVRRNAEKRILENEIQIDLDKLVVERAKEKLKAFSKS